MAEIGDLTERQREFARLIVSGERQTTAYRKAFDCNGKSEAAVRSDASRLARNANVVKLIAELRGQADSAAVMTWERRMALLSKQAEAEAKRGNWSGLIKIVDMLNKMDGTYETKKREAELEKAAKEEERKKAAEEANDSECTFAAILNEINKKTMAEKESKKEKLSENDGAMG